MSIDKNILIISNEPWGEIWFSKHHYAYELSKSHNVFFIDPPKKWKISNLFDSSIHIEKISDRLNVLRYKNFLPHYFLRFNNRIVSKRISKKLESLKINVDWFWSFDPQRLFEPALFKVSKSIFHVVDKYRFQNPAEIIFHKNVDGFVNVSEEFFSQYEKYGNPQIHVPHGISSDEFIIEDNHEWKLPYKDYILFAGNVDLRLDYQLIYQMATQFPNEIFVFIGGIKKVEDEFYSRIFEKKELKNIIYLPPVHAKKVKYYIHHSKCCLAPMKKDVPGNLISHHKTLQYMVHGKAVFSPVFSAYHSFSELLYMENESDDQLIILKNFLEKGEDTSLHEKRIALAQTHIYDLHIQKIIQFLERL